MSQRHFPVLTCTLAGFRMARDHWAFAARLLAFPILIVFMGFLMLDMIGWANNPFWATLFKLPGDFIKGIFLALVTRYVLFRELPAQVAETPDTQSDLAISALLTAAIGFVYGGIMSGLMLLYGEDGTIAQTSSPLAMGGAFAGLAAVLFLFRYQWLPVAAAAGYPLKPFIKFLGVDLGLSLRIFAMWTLASIPAFILLGFFGQIIASLGGFTKLSDLSGSAMWLFYLVNAVLTVLTSLITTCASIAALRHCMKMDRKNV